MTPDDPRHGAYAGYNAGCRDTCCRRAAAAYQRQRYFDHAVLGLPARCIDKTGSARRVHALQRIGWSAEYLSERMGFTPSYLNVAINRDSRRGINRSTANAITALFDQLCMTLGPSELTRKRAERKGWPPPLAWDDIDDPDEQPRGIRTRERRDLFTEWAELRDAGESIEQVARRFGVTISAIEKARERADGRCA